MRLRYSPVLFFSLLPIISLPCKAKDYPELSIGGSVKIDYEKYDSLFIEDADQGGEEFSIRRARLNFKADFSKHFTAKIKVDVHDGLDLKDAYIKYDAWDWANIVFGKQKEPFGLEQLMSTGDLAFNERSMMSSAISPGRNYGVSVFGSERAFTWQLGYFQHDKQNTENAFTGRLTWGLVNDKKNLIHVGTAVSERRYSLANDENSNDDTNFRVNEILEVYAADSLIEGIRINADKASHKGVEFAAQYNGLVGMAEWQTSTVTAISGSKYQYDGGYLQVSYLLSGKNRVYKDGMLDSVKTKHDWEVSLRYSELTLEEENSQANVLSLGVNYIINNDFKIKANLIEAQYNKAGSDLGSGNAVTLRAEYRF